MVSFTLSDWFTRLFWCIWFCWSSQSPCWILNSLGLITPDYVDYSASSMPVFPLGHSLKIGWAPGFHSMFTIFLSLESLNHVHCLLCDEIVHPYFSSFNVYFQPWTHKPKWMLAISNVKCRQMPQIRCVRLDSTTSLCIFFSFSSPGASWVPPSLVSNLLLNADESTLCFSDLYYIFHSPCHCHKSFFLF